MSPRSEDAHCPDCGTELPSDGATEGLCPQCLLSLALCDFEPGAGPDDRAETLDRPSAGRILGERYQMRELLGRGGMGEVWRAFDLKLRLDVALKAIHPDKATDERARELLRQEVRSAREVVSPNVCRIFDLVVEDGQELVSMELVDGVTLTETLRVRGPLLLQEAREIASQFLSGLEAIHQAGLVHRDFKPENVMLTRAGRVVVMDFGLAKGRTEGTTGTIAGTPAYMAPEQARGEAVDPRADVYSAGLVLAEMVVVGGEGAFKARQALWKGAREIPPQVPEGPWAPVLKQALAQSSADRYPSARALARALEEVTLRLPGFEVKRPYPGLASFTEEDAEYFFGREVEVEALLQKLKRPRLLALIGPSGAGKSSFLRAGLLPKLPRSWKAVLSTPGSRPFQALAQALAPALSGDTQAIQALLRFEEADEAVGLLHRFRQRNDHVLVVVDQFEELFTLNPVDVQKGFAELLGRLVLEADVHVLVSLRDDFLFRCHSHEPLAPILSDLTMLGPLSDSGLRRALVQPALACGYRFEDEGLVDEMVAEVSHERGALPLLAFAASRLWDDRNREVGLLTRQTYQEIGGVAGALAQHAEATLEKIGFHRAPVVRELFRNLITAQGTRAARKRHELLSVFGSGEVSPERVEATKVLDALVAARLLTAYEQPGEEGKEGSQEVEVIHESLLANWPRLVRWQTQDADGAQLRDQLRQAALAWETRGRQEDLLWSGAPYLDYRAWRTRYPGGLTSVEEEFAQAMTVRANRQRRRRRAAVTVAMAFLTIGLTIMGGLWRRAALEARTREAAQLLSLGRLRLDDHPSAALAYAIASLERADSEAARRFAVEALWQGPTEFIFGTEGAAPTVRFSPDGQWMALGSHHSARLYSSEGGTSRVVAPDQPLPFVGFSPDARRLLVRSQGAGPLRLFSLPDAQEVGSVPLGERPPEWVRGDRVLTFEGRGSSSAAGDLGMQTVLSWPLAGGTPTTLGTWDARGVTDFAVGADGSWLAEARSGTLSVRRLEALDRSTTLPVGRDEQTVWANPRRPALATVDSPGRAIHLWSVSKGEPKLERTLRASSSETIQTVTLDPNGRFVSARADGERVRHRLWDLMAPPDVEPLTLRDRDAEGFINGPDFGPMGHWLAVSHDKYGTLWALHDKRPRVLRGIKAPYLMGVGFSPDSRHLASASQGGEVWLWPLDPKGGERVRLLYEQNHWLGLFTPRFDPRGRFVIVSDINRGLLFRLPLHGGPPSVLHAATPWVGLQALRGDGRLLAASGSSMDAKGLNRLLVWDLETGTERALTLHAEGDSCAPGTAQEAEVEALTFLPDGRLLAEGMTGLRVFDLASGLSTRLRTCRPRTNISEDDTSLAVTPDGRTALIAYGSRDPGRTTEMLAFDLETRAERRIASHGDHLVTATLDPSGRYIVTGSGDGLVRVGRLSGGEPYLLYGHTALVTSIAVSPDGQWIASAGEDGTIRLWPMPDFGKPPLHTLPHDTLLSTLRALTNLRVVVDSGSATGYKIEVGPFPGWAKVPEW